MTLSKKHCRYFYQHFIAMQSVSVKSTHPSFTYAVCVIFCRDNVLLSFFFFSFKIHKALCVMVCIHVLCLCVCCKLSNFLYVGVRKKKCVATCHLIPRYPILLSGYYRYPFSAFFALTLKNVIGPFTVRACQHSDFRHDL